MEPFFQLLAEEKTTKDFAEALEISQKQQRLTVRTSREN
jgi:hypothetical protein